MAAVSVTGAFFLKHGSIIDYILVLLLNPIPIFMAVLLSFYFYIKQTKILRNSFTADFLRENRIDVKKLILYPLA